MDLKDVQDQINAEVLVTQGKLKDLLQKLGEGSPESMVASADYAAKAVLFRDRIRKATAQFERAIGDTRSGLFAQLYKLMYRYDATYRDQSLPDQAKTEILKAQKISLAAFLDSFGRQYRNELMGLVRASGFDLNAMTGYMSHESVAVYEGEYNLPKRAYEMIHRYSDEIVNKETGSEVFRFLRQGCYSKMCVQHSALDESTYVALVLSTFNNDVELRLADGAALKIRKVGRVCPIGGSENDEITQRETRMEGLDPSDNRIRYYACPTVKSATAWLNEALSKTDLFPREYSRLPARIGAQDMDKAVADRAIVEKMRARREKNLRKLAQALRDDESLGRDAAGIERYAKFFEYFCIAPIDYPNLRSQVGGCISDKEMNWLAKEYFSRKHSGTSYAVKAVELDETFRWYIGAKRYTCSVGQAYEKDYCQ